VAKATHAINREIVVATKIVKDFTCLGTTG